MREMAQNIPAVKSPRKLIEVALPLDKINVAAAREKSIRHGHPSTLHLWWARRPLAAARAVLFAQLVNDPGYERHLNRGVNKVEAAKERERLFKIIEDLVVWENTNNEQVLSAARAEIWKSWRETCELNRKHPEAATLFNPEKLPAFHDPFAGGGAIPLEAQRLGLESYASDLNPVAVTINKAMIEIPPRFANRVPIGPVPPGEREPSLSRTDWPGASGLAEDVRRYGAWIRSEAEKRIGQFYPEVQITKVMAATRPDLEPLVGQSLTVIAWLWARTVKSPNPAYSHVDVPLLSTFVVSSAKAGKEAYVRPIVSGDEYRFEVVKGEAPAGAEDGTKMSRGAFRCILSNTPITYAYIDDEANAGRMGSRLIAVVAEGVRARVYLSPTLEQETSAQAAIPEWRPETPCRGTFASNAQGRLYGFSVFGDYFTNRQLVALNTFSDLASQVKEKCERDAIAAGLPEDKVSLSHGGAGALAYGEAISVYSAFGVARSADAWSSIVTWRHQADATRNTFARQGIPMTWDFAEANPISNSCGNWTGNAVEWVYQSIEYLPLGGTSGHALQADAATQNISTGKIVSIESSLL